MYMIVTYDVSTETKEGRRRLRHVARACLDYGQRVQKSVFECSLGEKDLFRLKERLLAIIVPEEDSLRLYYINEPHQEHIEQYGRNQPLDFDAPLVV